MFIQATDNRLYKNPEIVGSNFLFRIVDDQCVIIVKTNNQSTINSCKKTVRSVMKATGINGKIIGISDDNGWVKNGILNEGSGWIIKLKDKIPIPTRHEGIVDYPSLGSSYLAWELEFHNYDILGIFNNNGVMNPIMIEFLTGKKYYQANEINDIRTKMKRILKKQVKGIDLNEDGKVRLKCAC